MWENLHREDMFKEIQHATPTRIFIILGMRFLRLLYLLQLPEVLQLMHILKSASKIRLAQIGSIFIAIWFTSSGFVHLVSSIYWTGSFTGGHYNSYTYHHLQMYLS